MIKGLRFILAFFAFATGIVTLNGQIPNTISGHIELIQTYSSGVSGISPFMDENGDIPAYNDSLASELVTLLKHKDLLKYDLDSIFDQLSVEKVKSDDGKFWIFNWYSNNGGSWQIYYEVLFAVLPNNTTYVSDAVEELATQIIYTFKVPEGKVYLAEKSGITCNTCFSYSATAYKITTDSLIEDEAFFNRERQGEALNVRMGNMEEFGYNPKTKLFRVKYTTDDQNVSELEEEWGELIEFEYYFNGEFLELKTK